MKVHVKKQIRLDGKVLDKGLHEISDHYSDHWFVKGLAKEGRLDVVGEVIPPPVLEPKAEVDEVVEEVEAEKEEAPKGSKKKKRG